jgi:hypothetical protein
MTTPTLAADVPIIRDLDTRPFRDIDPWPIVDEVPWERTVPLPRLRRQSNVTEVEKSSPYQGKVNVNTEKKADPVGPISITREWLRKRYGPEPEAGNQ